MFYNYSQGKSPLNEAIATNIACHQTELTIKEIKSTVLYDIYTWIMLAESETIPNPFEGKQDLVQKLLLVTLYVLFSL